MENKFFRLKKIKAQLKQFAPVLFLIISLALIGIGVSQNPVLIKTRMAFTNAFVPIVDIIGTPIRWVENGFLEVRELFRIRAENKRLRAENKKLLSWKNIALKLADDKRQLEKSLNYVPSREVAYLTARILADNGSSFARSLIVEAGAKNDLKKGAIALLPEGVIGRIVEVGEGVSRLLEITDYASRIPVMVGEQRILCILTGDNSDYPKLISLPEEAELSVGDRVVTSGHAGLFPSGLAIGSIVSDKNGEYIVAPFANPKKSEFVRLVDFGLDDVLIKKETCDCGDNE
ncbi:MAG: rod shape-determining protein MreC [Alphaproteobacteria bacterium]|nr:rod shape-determining protein MreC [Alphaproteobacteria bacterium]